MKNYTRRQAYLELHFSVLLWGFTGILGRLIQLDSSLLVWYRLFFTLISLLFFANLFKKIRTISPKVRWQMMAVGVIAAMHWVTFYGAIKIANVSVAVGSLATTSLFTAFLEPLFTKKKIETAQVAIGLLVTLGLSIMFFHGQDFKVGLLVGLLSAFLAALFSTLNKVIVDRDEPDPTAMTFVELGGGWLSLFLLVPIYQSIWPAESLVPGKTDLIWLVILAICCTTLPYILSLRALKKLSAFSSVLAINLEPIYSIILALFIFNENEELNWRFYLGTAIVIAAIFAYPLLSKTKTAK